MSKKIGGGPSSNGRRFGFGGRAGRAPGRRPPLGLLGKRAERADAPKPPGNQGRKSPGRGRGGGPPPPNKSRGSWC